MAKCYACGYNGGHHFMCPTASAQDEALKASVKKAYLKSALINLVAGIKEQGLEQWLEPQLLDAKAALESDSDKAQPAKPKPRPRPTK